MKNKSKNCVFRVKATKARLVHTLISGKKGSPNFLHTHLCGSCWVCVAISFFFPFYFFFISIISCSFPAAFSCTACHSPLSSVWSLSSSAPWKRSASWQKCTSAHTRPYSLQKGQSIWIFLFQAAPRWHGERKKKHKTGSVWQKPLLFIDWETRMTEWLTHLH